MKSIYGIKNSPAKANKRIRSLIKEQIENYM